MVALERLGDGGTGRWGRRVGCEGGDHAHGWREDTTAAGGRLGRPAGGACAAGRGQYGVRITLFGNGIANCGPLPLLHLRVCGGVRIARGDGAHARREVLRCSGLPGRSCWWWWWRRWPPADGDDRRRAQPGAAPSPWQRRPPAAVAIIVKLRAADAARRCPPPRHGASGDARHPRGLALAGRARHHRPPARGAGRDGGRRWLARGDPGAPACRSRTCSMRKLDQRRYVHSAPDDTLYSEQWYLMPSSAVTPSAIDAQSAWSITTGLDRAGDRRHRYRGALRPSGPAQRSRAAGGCCPATASSPTRSSPTTTPVRAPTRPIRVTGSPAPTCPSPNAPARRRAQYSSWHGTRVAGHPRRDHQQRARHRRGDLERADPAGARARRVRRCRLRHHHRHAVGGRHRRERCPDQRHTSQDHQYESRWHRCRARRATRTWSIRSPRSAC